MGPRYSATVKRDFIRKIKGHLIYPKTTYPTTGIQYRDRVAQPIGETDTFSAMVAPSFNTSPSVTDRIVDTKKS